VSRDRQQEAMGYARFPFLSLFLRSPSSISRRGFWRREEDDVQIFSLPLPPFNGRCRRGRAGVGFLLLPLVVAPISVKWKRRETGGEGGSCFPFSLFFSSENLPGRGEDFFDGGWRRGSSSRPLPSLQRWEMGLGRLCVRVGGQRWY